MHDEKVACTRANMVSYTAAADAHVRWPPFVILAAYGMVARGYLRERPMESLHTRVSTQLEGPDATLHMTPFD